MAAVRHSRSYLTADSCPIVVHNPGTLCDSLCFEQRKNARYDRKQGSTVLTSQSQDDDAVVTLRRIIFYVGEIQIECHKDARLIPANLGNRPIGRSTNTLLENRVSIVPVAPEQCS